MVPWYTDTISEAKHLKRKLEKQMKRTGLMVQQVMFKMTKTELRILREKSTGSHWQMSLINILRTRLMISDWVLVAMVKQTLI